MGSTAEAIVFLVLYVGLPLGMLLGAYLIGSYIERKHFASLIEREAATVSMPVVTLRSVPEGWGVERAGLVVGSVVISLDHFKRFLAALRAIVGGRVKSFEPLLDRARREALLRMKDDATRQGFDSVINVRFETSQIAKASNQGKQIAGVEVIAVGTGLRRQA